jgi:hypothetical protein
MVTVPESEPPRKPPAPWPWPFRALVVAVAALAVTTSLVASPPDATARTQPATACVAGEAVASACRLIESFFDALNRGNEVRACSLLGARLRFETGGASCPRVLGLSQGTPFEVIRARAAAAMVLVRVRVGRHELGHWRMLDWIVVVGPERGSLKLLDTKGVA